MRLLASRGPLAHLPQFRSGGNERPDFARESLNKHVHPAEDAARHPLVTLQSAYEQLDLSFVTPGAATTNGSTSAAKGGRIEHPDSFLPHGDPSEARRREICQVGGRSSHEAPSRTATGLACRPARFAVLRSGDCESRSPICMCERASLQSPVCPSSARPAAKPWDPAPRKSVQSACAKASAKGSRAFGSQSLGIRGGNPVCDWRFSPLPRDQPRQGPCQLAVAISRKGGARRGSYSRPDAAGDPAGGARGAGDACPLVLASQTEIRTGVGERSGRVG